jgi:putative intracellular protease/amidase
MLASPEYRQPAAWADTDLEDVDGLLLPGGHRARGMRSYIESDVLQRLVSEAFRRKIVVAATVTECCSPPEPSIQRRVARCSTAVRRRR